MSPFGTQILELLDSPEYQPSKTSQLAKQLQVTKSQVSEFKEALEDLIESGLVRKQANGILRRRTAKGLVTGIVRRAAAGFGFLTPTDAPNDRSRDIYVSKEDL